MLTSALAPTPGATISLDGYWVSTFSLNIWKFWLQAFIPGSLRLKILMWSESMFGFGRMLSAHTSKRLLLRCNSAPDFGFWLGLPPSVDNINRWEKISILGIIWWLHHRTGTRRGLDRPLAFLKKLQCLSHIEERPFGHVKGVDVFASFGTRGFGSSRQTAAWCTSSKGRNKPAEERKGSNWIKLDEIKSNKGYYSSKQNYENYFAWLFRLVQLSRFHFWVANVIGVSSFMFWIHCPPLPHESLRAPDAGYWAQWHFVSKYLSTDFAGLQTQEKCLSKGGLGSLGSLLSELWSQELVPVLTPPQLWSQWLI